MQLLRIDFSRCSLPQVVLDEHKISRESKPPTQVDNPKQGLWISHKVLVTTVPNRRKIQIIWSLWTNHCTPCWRLCWPTTPTNTGFSPPFIEDKSMNMFVGSKIEENRGMIEVWGMEIGFKGKNFVEADRIWVSLTYEQVLATMEFWWLVLESSF